MITRHSGQRAALEEVLAAIPEPPVRASVQTIIDKSVLAIWHLASLDDELFEQAAMLGPGAGPTAAGLDQLMARDMRDLSRRVLGSTRALITHLEAQRFAGEESAGAAHSFDDLEFDMGVGTSPAEMVDQPLAEDDILSAIDGLDAQETVPSSDRWKSLQPELSSLTFALGSQLTDFERRYASALDESRRLQALRELDDIGNALTDGILALMGTICEAYLEDIDRDRLLPGHQSALGKALLVRRGIADLRRIVNHRNAILQDQDATDSMRETAFEKLREAVVAFAAGDVMKAMRPADRAELASFARELRANTFKSAAMTCEGLDKYLDSLAVVNQRDVLIKHDTDLKRDIADNLEGAIQLADISPHGTIDMVRAAFERANALYGHRDAIDALLIEWQKGESDVLDVDGMVQWGRRLDQLIT